MIASCAVNDFGRNMILTWGASLGIMGIKCSTIHMLSFVPSIGVRNDIHTVQQFDLEHEEFEIVET